MDDIEKQLLVFLQHGIPVEKRPFEAMAGRFGMDAAEILLRIGRLKGLGKLSGLRAIFDGKKLGYQSTLVAMKTDGEDIETRSAFLERHPGVHGLHMREHDYNLWFTLSVPGEEDLAGHVARLQEQFQCPRVLLLPAVRVFKPAQDGGPQGYCEDFRWRAEEIRIIRKLQEPFPLTDEPFHALASDLDMPAEEVMSTVRSLISKGALRAIRAVAEQLRAHEPQSLMVVWNIPEEKLLRSGERAAQSSFVKHCSARRAYSDFPYSLYLTLDCGGAEEAAVMTREIEDRIGSWPRAVLRVLRTFPRKRVVYFSEAFERWQSPMAPEEVSRAEVCRS
ncbi:MAG: hypothetical protein WC352_00680 [Candidatus Omnitrophota bacterium]|jgi:DNA-binding Lrp family transcriptional regulator